MSAKILKKTFKDRIKINPFTLTGNLYPLVDNGDGDMIEDRNATPESKSYTKHVRISTRKKWVMEKKHDQTPVNTQIFDWYMISDNETIVDERLEFTYHNMNFKVTKRKENRKYGEVIGYEYELKDITEDSTYA